MLDQVQKRGLTFRKVMQRSTGGPQLAEFRLARSPVQHNLELALNGTIPRFSTIF